MDEKIILKEDGECYRLAYVSTLKDERNECDFFVERNCDFDVVLPQKAHEGDAGWDLFIPNVKHDFILDPHYRTTIDLGIKTMFNEGFVLKLEEKSGLAKNSGLQIMGGIVDSSYRGNIGVNLYNSGNIPIIIKPNMKICQALLMKCNTSKYIPERILSFYVTNDETTRNAGGFGSTGLH